MTYERICCPKCQVTFGQEAKFVLHLNEAHDISDPLSLYLEVYHKGSQPTCHCSNQCIAKLPWAGWKKGFLSSYARGHNARIDSSYHDKDKQKEMARKRSEGYASGKYAVWNKGQTKDTSSKLAVISSTISNTLLEGYASGRLTDWRKLAPEKAVIAACKMSETKSRLYASGELVPWNLGLTKSSSLALLKSSDSIKKNYETNPGASAKRFKPEQVIAIVESIGKFELLDDPACYRNKYHKLRLKCNACGQIQLKNLMMLIGSPVCFSCAPKESKGQLEVYDFVRSISLDAVLSSRDLIAPKEIDVLVPSAKLAIEYNGLYWHSAANISNKNYHEMKRKLVEEAGYSFFMIFEDEWRDRRHIVESMIRHRLKSRGEILDARKLRITEIDNKTAANFFEASHLEGHAMCSSCLALVDSSGRIVAAMSLRRPFHASRASASIEVARSACLPGITIRGWIGKLTVAALKKAKSQGYESLVSYVDARIGNGKGYLSAGWELESMPRTPRFWWTDFHDRFNRFKFKADKNSGLSQFEVANDAGVTEIWGCGNYVVRCS
jgi:hypothetical protein